MKRQRSRNNNNRQQNTNRALESNGPGVKVRGAASTIYEKYQQLARDASLSGDRIMSENYLQFAEHYFRIMREQQAQREQREMEQAAQQAARKAEYEARKAQQQERSAAAPVAGNQDKQEDASQDNAPVSQVQGSNGAGPMDVVTPQAGPKQEAKPARSPRRRMRRPAPLAAQVTAGSSGPDGNKPA